MNNGTIARKNYLLSFCSLNVVNSIMLDDTIKNSIKRKAIERAREIAKEAGRYRVYLKDYHSALKEVEK